MRAGSRGFTVIEILIVVVILAIAAGIAIPMMNPDSVKLPAAARMVASDLSYAQNVAQSRQQRVYVYFQSSGGAISSYEVKIAVKNQDGTVTLVPVTQPGGVDPLKRSFGPSASDGSGTPMTSCQIASVQTGGANITTLGFDAQGQPVSSSGGTDTAFTSAGKVQITDLKGGAAIDITIQPVTGLISVPK